MIFLFFLYKLVFLFFSFIPPPEKRIKTFILYLGVKGLEAEDEVFFKHFVSISEIHPVFHFWGSKITPVRGKGLRTLTGCLSEVRKGRKPPLRFKHSEGHTAWRVGPCRGPALRCAAEVGACLGEPPWARVLPVPQRALFRVVAHSETVRCLTPSFVSRIYFSEISCFPCLHFFLLSLLGIWGYHELQGDD